MGKLLTWLKDLVLGAWDKGWTLGAAGAIGAGVATVAGDLNPVYIGAMAGLIGRLVGSVKISL